MDLLKRVFRRSLNYLWLLVHEDVDVHLWVDKEPPPKPVLGRPAWIWVRTADEAISILDGYRVERMSLGYRLAKGTGYDVCMFLERYPVLLPMFIRIHSLDTLGTTRMKAAIEAARRRAEFDEDIARRRGLLWMV